MAHLYDEGVSGWKEQTSPSSTSRLPQAVAGSREVYRCSGHVVLREICQTTSAAETRTAWRFPPWNPHKRRIWIPGPSWWTKCLTFVQLGRSWIWHRQTIDGFATKAPTASCKLSVPRRVGECDYRIPNVAKRQPSFEVWFTHQQYHRHHSSCIIPRLFPHDEKRELWKAKAEPVSNT